jgi:hypothetical protein
MEAVVPKARLTVVEHSYYQSSEKGRQPIAVNTGFCTEIDSDEEPYGPRRIIVGPEWRKLELGWMQNCSQLCLTNLAGTDLEVIPTPEERNAISKQVIEVGVLQTPDTDGVPRVFGWIRPGRSMRFEPYNLDAIMLRSQYCIPEDTTTYLNKVWKTCKPGSIKLSMSIFPQ